MAFKAAAAQNANLALSLKQVDSMVLGTQNPLPTVQANKPKTDRVQ
jgi:hypothetical protein